MAAILNYIETAVVLIVMFTVLVAAHEYGHYLFARLFNMGVEEFSLGFGPRPLFQWMRRTYTVPVRPGEVPEIDGVNGGGINLESAGTRPAGDIEIIDTPTGQVLRETTRFTVRAWPLGGFVRIKGMLPQEDGSETTIAGGFYNKPPWQRLVVLFAGPLFSVLAGIAILTPLFAVEGAKPNNEPVLGHLSPEGAATHAGLKEGDRVVSIDGTPIHSFFGIVQIVRSSPDKKLDFEVARGDRNLSISVVPKMDTEPTPVLKPDLDLSSDLKLQPKLGAGPVLDPYPIGEALGKAVSFPVEAVESLFSMVHHPSTIKDNVGGPVSIARVTSETVKNGTASVIQLAALLSISVGVLNLLPVVPLDGGQMALAIAEMLRRGKRLSMQMQSVASLCGMAFMGVLILCVFFIDISRIFDHEGPPKPPPAKRAAK